MRKERVSAVRRLPSRAIAIATILALFVALTMGCSRSDHPSEVGSHELEMGSLPSGVEIFGSKPENGALLLFEIIDIASWVVFFEDETCLLDIERSKSSYRHEPIVELSSDALVSSASCNSPEWFRDKGMIAIGDDDRQTLISAVLPVKYWSESWTLDNVEQLTPFKVLEISPYSFHLIAPYPDVTKARQTQTLGNFIDIRIACKCSDLTMRAYII